MNLLNILVTGSSGQLGIEFTNFLNQHEYIVDSISKDDLDISNFADLETYFENHSYDLVINCAAYTLVYKAETEIDKCMNINELGPKNLAILSTKHNFRLVHFSTDYVFDGVKKGPYEINDDTNPLSIYGKSKLNGENMIRSNSQKYFIIRTSWLYGSGKSNFIYRLHTWSKKNNELNIVEDEISTPTYTNDLVKSVMKLVKTNLYGIYHITNTGSCSRFEFATFVLNKIGWTGRLNRVNQDFFCLAAKRPKYSVLSNKNLPSDILAEQRDWRDAVTAYLKTI